jgi:putative membrane protein
MIVRPRPHPLQLLFIIRGSIIIDIAPKVLTILALACAVVWLSHIYPTILLATGAVPFSIIGLALSVFLGFRNNACYDRWWEARKHWGDLIVQARALARESDALLIDPATRRRVVHGVIGFAHALAASLRGQDALALSGKWLPAGLQDRLQTAPNIPDTILRGINQELAGCLRQGELTDVLYQGLSQRLLALTAIQAACERIRNTPVPFAYSLLLHRTAWLFCLLLPFGLVAALGEMTPLVVTLIAYTFFGLDSLGDELEEPFGVLENNLPLNALVRIIEIDLLSGLGETELPAPLKPEGFVLL